MTDERREPTGVGVLAELSERTVCVDRAKLDELLKLLEIADAEQEALKARCERYEKALRYYAEGNISDDGEPGERREFGCGCCAGTLVMDDDYVTTEYDKSVIGLTAREALGG